MQQPREFLDLVLVAVLGVDALAAREAAAAARPGHVAIGQRFQVHLDARGFWIEEGPMAPLVQVEVAADQPVHVRQHVEVELGRDTGRVVVGGFEHTHVLAQVHADEQGAVVLHQPTHARQQVERLRAVEIADRRPGVEDQAMRGRQICRQVDALRQVAGQRLHLQRRHVGLQAGHRFLQEVGRDVDRHVLRRIDGTAQVAGLFAIARTRLDDDAPGPDTPRDLAGMTLEHGRFGAGGVVLRQARDLLEQARAALVVEILGRNARGVARQPLDDVEMQGVMHSGRSWLRQAGLRYAAARKSPGRHG